MMIFIRLPDFVGNVRNVADNFAHAATRFCARKIFAPKISPNFSFRRFVHPDSTELSAVIIGEVFI
jgi:hypothetical protein